LLSKPELERHALAEIRKCPRCETLNSVDEEYSELRADTNWTPYAFTNGRIVPGALKNCALEATVNNLHPNTNCACQNDLLKGGGATPGLLKFMPKKNMTADELIWLFHEKLAGTDLPNAKIAVIPIGGGSWSAMTDASERRRYPHLATTVARIEKQMRGRYNLRES